MSAHRSKRNTTVDGRRAQSTDPRSHSTKEIQRGRVRECDGDGEGEGRSREETKMWKTGMCAAVGNGESGTGYFDVSRAWNGPKA
jgi:hypothetical protein